jgi:hypothetical protein
LKSKELDSPVSKFRLLVIMENQGAGKR